MDEAEQRILQMLEDGVISAEDADNLLLALRPNDRVTEVGGKGVIASENVDTIQEETPDMDRFRGFWRIPLFVATGSTILTGIGLILLYQSTGVAALGFLCTWSLFIVAALATVFMLMTRRSPWLHVRIRESNGHRFAISLPLPIRLAKVGMAIARSFMPKEQVMYLETAETFLTVMQENPDQEPIFINVDDDDGDKVQVYIG